MSPVERGPRGATGFAFFDITYDANGNHIRTLKRDTGDAMQHLNRDG
jgi:hypothetical protein